MTRNSKQKAVLAAAVLVLAIGAIIAVVTGTGHGHPSHKPVGGLPANSFGSAVGSGEIVRAASYLGLTRARLMQAMRSGHTLAQLADTTPGKSTNGLVEALISVRKARLERARIAGKLSQARVSARLAAIALRTRTRVSRPLRKGRRPD